MGKITSEVKDAAGRWYFKAAVLPVVSVGMVLGLVGVSSAADTTDPGVTSAITDGFGGLVALVVGVLATALFGITVAILGIRMGVKWLRKGASQ